MKTIHSTSILLMILLLFLGLSCKQDSSNFTTKEDKTNQLGELTFQVNGTVEAIPYFEKGVLLLHSFEYEDAREAFSEAQRIDSSFVMAYWGEAMTYNHSLWQKQEKEKALNALTKLAPTADERMRLAQTELEKDFLKAIEILYGEGTKYERDVAYKEFMQKLSKKHPNHHEVSAFYAISLLGTSRNGRDEELYDKSARIAQGILKENPNHPGALHYLIHSYDDPKHAYLAIDAANEYSVVAPDASHALHMPSHIYVALGKWEEVIASNIASWNAAVKRKQRKNLDDKSGSYHALNWLQYGLLQKGEKTKAKELINRMEEYAALRPKKNARQYLVAMKGAQMIETNTWDGALADIKIKVDDLNIARNAAYYFLEGMKLHHQDKQDEFEILIDDMSKTRQTAQLGVGEQGFAMCSSGGSASKPPSQLDIDIAHVMEMQLNALLASKRGKNQEAMEWFEKGTKLDESLHYAFGPPRILKPIHEAYGEWLLKTGKNKEALQMFDKSLERHPRRLLSLQGKKQAATALGNDATLMAINKEIELSLTTKHRIPIL